MNPLPDNKLDDEWVKFLTEAVILPAATACMHLLRDDRNPPSKVYAHVAENTAPKLKTALTQLITEARLETAEECERLALKAATRTPHDTLDVMVVLEAYVKKLKALGSSDNE